MAFFSFTLLWARFFISCLIDPDSWLTLESFKWIFLCQVKSFLYQKPFPQSRHLKGFSPEWILWCCVKSFLLPRPELKCRPLILYDLSLSMSANPRLPLVTWPSTHEARSLEGRVFSLKTTSIERVYLLQFAYFISVDIRPPLKGNH